MSRLAKARRDVFFCKPLRLGMLLLLTPTSIWPTMIRRALYQIAGIDRETLATCPATDKLWATHLGLSLLLSFTVVLGITFHATGYVIANPWMRLFASTVVALTVFMFDRALYQSDWFTQGVLRQPAGNAERGDSWQALRRFFRITIRLSISLGLAWVIAVFLELAVFSDTISEKIKRDHVAANQPVYAKIEQYEAQLAAEIEQRRRDLAALGELQRKELADNSAAPTRSDDHAPQIGALDDEIAKLDAPEQELRLELRQVEDKIRSYAEDMNAEELGKRINPASSGRAGAGPRYQFARRQKEVYEARRTFIQSELSQLRDKREQLRTQQRRLTEDAGARREQDRAAVQGRRDALQARIDAARTELNGLEGSRLASIEAFRQKALAASDFQKQKDDPLSRMTAYQELKNDPKDGATVVLFSWMTRFLVIFLEIVPVVAKMFFSPPSVYAVRIQAEVEREREKARLASEAVRVEPQPIAEAGAEPPPSEPARPIADDGSPQRPADRIDGSAAAGRKGDGRKSDLAALLRSLEIEPVRDPLRQEMEAAIRAAEGGEEQTAIRAIDAHLREVEPSSKQARTGSLVAAVPSDLELSERERTELAPLIVPLPDDIPRKQ